MDADVAGDQVELGQQGLQGFLQLEAAVVGAEGDGAVRRGDAHKLVGGYLFDPDAAGGGALTGQGRDDGADGDAKNAAVRDVPFCDDRTHSVNLYCTGNCGAGREARG